MFIKASQTDPFLLDEVETARCVELCREYLIEGAPAPALAEELAMAWIAVAADTLQERQGLDSIGKISFCFPFLS